MPECPGELMRGDCGNRKAANPEYNYGNHGDCQNRAFFQRNYTDIADIIDDCSGHIPQDDLRVPCIAVFHPLRVIGNQALPARLANFLNIPQRPIRKRINMIRAVIPIPVTTVSGQSSASTKAPTMVLQFHNNPRTAFSSSIHGWNPPPGSGFSALHSAGTQKYADACSRRARARRALPRPAPLRSSSSPAGAGSAPDHR